MKLKGLNGTVMRTTVKELPKDIACLGISVRTTNQAELNPETAKISGLWQTFFNTYFAKLPKDSGIYRIYHNYQSDINGEFEVTASWNHDCNNPELENDTLESVTIPAGKYLVFSEQGTMPDAVIAAWKKVWAYFNDSNCQYTRLFDVDFEHYVSESQVDVYIRVKVGYYLLHRENQCQ